MSVGRWIRREQERLLLGAAGLVVVAATVPPLLSVLASARAAGGDLSGPHPELSLLVNLSASLGLLARSIALAAAVAALSVALGVPLGFLFARARVAGRRIGLLLHGFPIFVPPFLLALGWFHLFGRDGLIGAEWTSKLLFGPIGLVVVLSLGFAPVVTFLVALGLASIDPSLEEAARTAASPWRVATRILLPLVAPAIGLGAVVVFALAFSELGVPMFLRVRAYPAAVFARLGGVDYEPREAVALAVPLVLVAGAVLLAERLLASRGSFGVLGLRIRDRRVISSDRGRAAASLACWSAAALSLAPLLALALRSGVSGAVAASEWIGRSLGTSLLTAFAAATIVAVVSLPLGWGLARAQPIARGIDAVAVLGFVTPAALLGVGLIATWNRPWGQVVYTTPAILVVGYLARYAIIGVRAAAVAVAQSSATLEESAAAFGARFGRRLLRIVLPLHARGIAAAWLFALVFCLRDLETAVLFYPPGRETLPVRIFTLEANGPPAVVAGLAMWHVLVTAAVVAVGAFVLLGWRSRRVR